MCAIAGLIRDIEKASPAWSNISREHRWLDQRCRDGRARAIRDSRAASVIMKMLDVMASFAMIMQGAGTLAAVV